MAFALSDSYVTYLNVLARTVLLQDYVQKQEMELHRQIAQLQTARGFLQNLNDATKILAHVPELFTPTSVNFMQNHYMEIYQRISPILPYLKSSTHFVTTAPLSSPVISSTVLGHARPVSVASLPTTDPTIVISALAVATNTESVQKVAPKTPPPSPVLASVRASATDEASVRNDKKTASPIPLYYVGSSKTADNILARSCHEAIDAATHGKTVTINDKVGAKRKADIPMTTLKLEPPVLPPSSKRGKPNNSI